MTPLKPPRRTVLYRFFNDADELLYVAYNHGVSQKWERLTRQNAST